ncbi:HDIG domain-containing protein [Candidatus Woesearchaeota archaeon]|nr:HDIG domain-containing protein [Candidatus Woesearchaeota archaeon]
MNLPNKKEIEKLWGKYHVPQNVREHCKKVRDVAVLIAEKLKEKGEDINLELVEASALLHDLARAVNFKDPENHPHAKGEDAKFWKHMQEEYPDIDHADLAAEFLQEKYPELAKVIKSHGVMSKSQDISDWSWEMKILSYADIRVVHDKITTVDERHRDLKQRNGDFFSQLKQKTGIDYIDLIFTQIERIEKQIFSIIDIKPEEIK